MKKSHADRVGEVLHHLKMNGVYYCRTDLAAPWGLMMPNLDNKLIFHVNLSGSCWFESGRKQTKLSQGDFVLITKGKGHKLRSSKEVPADDILSFQREHVSSCYDILTNKKDGEKTVLLCGIVQFEHPSAKLLIDSLPPIIHIERAKSKFSDWIESTVNFISLEAAAPQVGGEAVITRLADILVIQAIRSWIESHPKEQVGWIAALGDEKIGKSLSLIHSNPGSDWTIEKLASQVGMSRASFATHFAKKVGEPVAQYLTKWRMNLAASRIHSEDVSIPELSESLGYKSEAAFRRSFKKIMGFNPGQIKKQKQSE